MKPTLEQLEPRECPAEITFHGGPVLQSPQLIDVAVGVAPGPGDALAQILTTDYMRLLAPYGISAAASMAQSVALPSQGPLTEAQIPALLAAEIKAGILPAPTANSLYMVYLPSPPTDQPQFVEAYHSFFTLPGFGTVVYAVVPQNFYDWSRAASHEYAEAATDPQLNAWYDTATGDEIGDVYNSYEFAWKGWVLQVLCAPDGSMLGLKPTQADLFALAVAELQRDFWSDVSRILPQFGAQAAAAQAAINGNPAYGSAEGADALALGDQVFASWLESI